MATINDVELPSGEGGMNPILFAPQDSIPFDNEPMSLYDEETQRAQQDMLGPYREPMPDIMGIGDGKPTLEVPSVEQPLSFEVPKQFAPQPQEKSIIEQNKLIPDIIQKSKSYLLELITYYVCSRKYAENYTISLGEGGKSLGGEKDIVLVSHDEKEAIIIECKFNPQSYDIKTIAEKLDAKLLDYPKQEKKSAQLWCWEELSIQNKQALDLLTVSNNPISYVELSNPKKYPILREINLRQLKFIMQDYTKND